MTHRRLSGVYFLFITALIIAVLIVAVDQAAKLLVICYLKPLGSVSVIPHLLDFTYLENKGAAFGMLENKRWLFIACTAVALLLMIIFLIWKKSDSKLLNFSLAFIIGGGIGNLIDRILYGYVVDFISLSFFPPVCNIADYFVTAGTVMFIIYILFISDRFKGSGKKRKKNG